MQVRGQDVWPSDLRFLLLRSVGRVGPWMTAPSVLLIQKCLIPKMVLRLYIRTDILEGFVVQTLAMC